MLKYWLLVWISLELEDCFKTVYEDKNSNLQNINRKVIDSDDETYNYKELSQNNFQAKDEIGHVIIDEALSNFSSRWRNYVVRFIFAIIMISGFSIICYLGPVSIICLVLTLQLRCYYEVISIGCMKYKSDKLPMFHSLSLYMFFVVSYYFYGKLLVNYIDPWIPGVVPFYILLHHHNQISYLLYILGIIWFVISLRKELIMEQYAMFAWTHVTMVLFAPATLYVLENMEQGLIWLLIPIILSTLNDIMAHQCGFFFGKTPLIEVSPKKTWEGFVGGGILTVILSIFAAHFLCQYNFLVCPIEFSEKSIQPVIECQPGELFQLATYKMDIPWLKSLLNWSLHIETYPFVFHSIAFSLFSSIIGPFGGFFASGFKRAVKIKDFGGMIPGHGGVIDRLDCQLLMQLFVHVYIDSFINSTYTRPPNFNLTLSQILKLPTEDQLNIYNSLKSIGMS